MKSIISVANCYGVGCTLTKRYLLLLLQLSSRVLVLSLLDIRDLFDRCDYQINWTEKLSAATAPSSLLQTALQPCHFLTTHWSALCRQKVNSWL